MIHKLFCPYYYWVIKIEDDSYITYILVRLVRKTLT
jgi:hypothetical protein